MCLEPRCWTFSTARDWCDGLWRSLPREIWKIVENSDGNTYRAVYAAVFREVVYVLDLF